MYPFKGIKWKKEKLKLYRNVHENQFLKKNPNFPKKIYTSKDVLRELTTVRHHISQSLFDMFKVKDKVFSTKQAVTKHFEGGEEATYNQRVKKNGMPPYM